MLNTRQKEVQQTHLNEEKKIIRQLKRVYSQASKDCEAKIKELASRVDLQNLQSIVYQKQYQEALKKQIDGILDTLQNNEFASIAEYLTTAYENGFYGSLYDLHGQGIPVIFPIDQRQVVQALETDSQLSEGLYNRLGEDTGKLKKSIRAELSRGAANGSSWLEIAAHIANGMNSPFKRGINNAIRIARTEGHRIQNQAQLDTISEAKRHGADVLKQWESTLDGRTRPDHRKADGQIRELDEDFDVGGEKLKAPGIGGSAKNVCNCRCFLTQPARWALDEEELEELKKRAAFLGLDKTEDFEDFKRKYLKAADESDTIKLPDTAIHKSVGAKASNYDILDAESGKYFHFAEGTKIQNSQVFAGRGVRKPLNEQVANGLSEQIGGRPENWQHCKGNATIDYDGEERPAEVHWFQEESVGKHKFKIKRWLDE